MVSSLSVQPRRFLHPRGHPSCAPAFWFQDYANHARCARLPGSGVRQAFSRNGVHRGGRSAAVREVCKFICSVPTGQPIEAGRTRGQDRSLGTVRMRSKPAGRGYVHEANELCLRHSEKGKGTPSRGVISCRGGEASLIPHNTRIAATTECYNSFILGRCIDYLDPQLLKYRYRNNMTPV